MRNSFIYLFIIIVCSISFNANAQGCYITSVSQGTVEFSYSGGTKSTTVSFPAGGCSSPTITVGNAPSWLTIFVSGTYISIQCAPLTSGYRQVSIPILVNGSTVNGFMVKQGIEPPPPPPPTCTISGFDSVNFSYEGEEIEFPLSFSNCGYSSATFNFATTNGQPIPSWISSINQTGTSIFITCEPNYSNETRSEIIIGTNTNGSGVSIGAAISQRSYSYLYFDYGLSNENLIYTRKPKIPSQNISELNDNELNESVTYYNGLGKPKQNIGIRAGGQEQDIITQIEYDDFGRVAKEFLPTPLNNNHGLYQSNINPVTANYYYNEYGENTYFSEKKYSNSTSGFVEEIGATGDSWAVTPNNSNTNLDQEISFSINFNNENVYKSYKKATIIDDVYFIDSKIVYDSPSTLNFSGTEDTQGLITGNHDLGFIKNENFENTPYKVKVLNGIISIEDTGSGTYTALEYNINTAFTLVNNRVLSPHTIKNNVSVNDVDEVKLYKVNYIGDDPELVDGGSYLKGTLTKTIIKDENWTSGFNHTMEEFKDKLGQIILKRTYADYNGQLQVPHDTHYVYNDFGNLIYVLPPMFTGIGGNSVSDRSRVYYSWQNFMDTYIGGGGSSNYIEVVNSKLKVVFSAGFTTQPLKTAGIVQSLGWLDIPDLTIGSFGSGHYTAFIRSGNLYIEGDGTSISGLNLNVEIDLSGGSSGGSLNDLCYQYKYDERKRLIEKQIPGKEKEYIVYNKLDQPIMTQDANLRAQNKWLFTKYDAFGRVAYTGITYGGSRSSIQTIVDGITTQYVTKTTTASTIGGTTIYYNNGAYPISIPEIHTINYYDNYTFNKDGLTLPSTAEGQAIVNYNNAANTHKLTKGLATGSKIRVLDVPGPLNWITTLSGYDTKGRPIYVVSKNNYLATTDISISKLDFIGTVDKTITTHDKSGHSTITTVNLFDYDHSGRLLSQKQSINSQPNEIIVENTYNELGQLISKGVGGTNPLLRLQTVDYGYNIRGWLQNINDVNSIGDDLFTFKIYYNDAPTSGGSVSLFNGNISNIKWKTKSDNVMYRYIYHYDALNRIEKADFSSVSIWSRYRLGNVDYDKNGNITKLNRKGHIVEEPERENFSDFGLMDNLNYYYNGNQLHSITEVASGADTGFFDGNTSDSSYSSTTDNDYVYDDNGNLIEDKNKGITSITYNHLNLPKKITMPFGNIEYIYNAVGIKLKKIVDDNSLPEVNTEYAGNYIYVENDLQFFNHAEGVVKSDGSGGYDYTYQYKDHLGNIRLSYSDYDGDGEIDVTTSPSTNEIVEENNYYPFGLKHEGYNEGINGVHHKFEFQGQETQNELGLNWISFKWRNHDPEIGRFWSIDPLTEKYEWMTQYQFSSNQPIHAQEIEGLESSADLNLRLYVASKLSERDGSDLIENYKALQNAERGEPIETADVFKTFFPKGGAARSLIDHYGNGNGNTYNLSQNELLEVYPLTDRNANPINLSLSNSDMLSVGNLSPGESAVFKDNVQVYAGTAGTLGNFTIKREGIITLNAKTGRREFSGNFLFNDIYDFNPGNRPGNAESQVTIARNFLPGIPFAIFGSLPVNQVQGFNVTTMYNGFIFIPSNIPKPGPTEERQEAGN